MVRYSRVLVTLAVAALAIGGAVVVRAARPTPRAVRSSAAVLPLLLHRALQQEAQQLIVPRLRSVVPASRPPVVPEVGGQTCFVGPGRCSETPCVVPVQGSVTTGSAVVSAVAQKTVIPRALSTRCPGGEVAPKALRVVSP